MNMSEMHPIVRPSQVPIRMPIADGALWQQARALRSQFWGRDVYLRGIVEFSNHCRQNCLYCGLRRDNTGVFRFRMTEEDIVGRARILQKLGCGTVVLQSGEDPEYSGPAMAAVITRIKTELGLAVALSLGEREEAEYRLWREAGADRYLLKLETLDAGLYAFLRPGKRLADRRRALDTLKALGYETGVGLMAGLPGESGKRVEQSIRAVANLNPDMLSIIPFAPHPATPLGAQAPCEAARALRCMALARVYLPQAHIPAARTLGLYGDSVRLDGLEVGNTLILSLTPKTLHDACAICLGKNRDTEEHARAIRAMVLQAGFTLPQGPGRAWRLGEA